MVILKIYLAASMIYLNFKIIGQTGKKLEAHSLKYLKTGTIWEINKIIINKSIKIYVT